MNIYEMTTEQVIEDMLKENTGASILDSGSAYGRNWEKNQTRRFKAEPPAYFNITEHSDGDIQFTYHKSTYHFIKEHAEFHSDLQREFDQFAMMIELGLEPREIDKLALDAYEHIDYKVFNLILKQFNPNHNATWLNKMELFGEYKVLRNNATGLYHEGKPYVVNTYNHDGSVLDQIIQYLLFGVETLCALIQVHGGCDVRGGYSAPKAFMIDEGLLFDTDGSIFCDNKTCREMWRTDNGGRNWQSEYLQHKAFEKYSDEEIKVKLDSDGQRVLICPACSVGIIKAGL